MAGAGLRVQHEATCISDGQVGGEEEKHRDLHRVAMGQEMRLVNILVKNKNSCSEFSLNVCALKSGITRRV
jgi:hypothetical protein